MSPEKQKQKILELAEPIFQLMKENKIYFIYLPTSDDGREEFNIEIKMRGKIPEKIKNTLSVFGSIYIIDDE